MDHFVAIFIVIAGLCAIRLAKQCFAKPDILPELQGVANLTLKYGDHEIKCAGCVFKQIDRRACNNLIVTTFRFEAYAVVGMDF